MPRIDVPARSEVSADNQAIFDQLEGKLGMVPNLYATYAHSETALANYLAFQGAKSSIDGKAREVVNLAVSQANDCAYCLAAHTALGGMVGFTPEQIVEIRQGRASFDSKLDVLARLSRRLVETRGHVEAALVEEFLGAGWTKGNLVDAISAVGDKTISNYLHAATEVPVDFPAAPALPGRVADAA